MRGFSYLLCFRAITVMFAMLGLTGLAPSPVLAKELRQLELRITDHRPGIADFEYLSVQLAAVSIHSKGASRKQGWRELVRNTRAVDIVPLKEGRFEILTIVNLPAERFDALRIEFSKLEGRLLNGTMAKLLARDTTLKIRIDTRQAQRSVMVVDLFAESQIDHAPNRYVVKVKEVRVSG